MTACCFEITGILLQRKSLEEYNKGLTAIIIRWWDFRLLLPPLFFFWHKELFTEKIDGEVKQKASLTLRPSVTQNSFLRNCEVLNRHKFIGSREVAGEPCRDKWHVSGWDTWEKRRAGAGPRRVSAHLSSLGGLTSPCSPALPTPLPSCQMTMPCRRLGSSRFWEARTLCQALDWALAAASYWFSLLLLQGEGPQRHQVGNSPWSIW